MSDVSVTVLSTCELDELRTCQVVAQVVAQVMDAEDYTKVASLGVGEAVHATPRWLLPRIGRRPRTTAGHRHGRRVLRVLESSAEAALLERSWRMSARSRHDIS